MSIDGEEVDSSEGNVGGIYLGACLSGLNAGDGEDAILKGAVRFTCGFLMVSLW
jgi:hypothetical protein